MSGGTTSLFGRGGTPTKAGEVDVAALAPRVPVVVRDPVVELDLEPQGVPVVVSCATDVGDEQDGRVSGQPHTTAASPSSAFTSAKKSELGATR